MTSCRSSKATSRTENKESHEQRTLWSVDSVTVRDTVWVTVSPCSGGIDTTVRGHSVVKRRSQTGDSSRHVTLYHTADSVAAAEATVVAADAGKLLWRRVAIVSIIIHIIVIIWHAILRRLNKR